MLTAAPGWADEPPVRVPEFAEMGWPKDPPQSSPAKARELWEKGLREWEAKRYQEADSYLMEAWRVSSDPWFACMLGYIHERAGFEAAAASSYSACERVARKQKDTSGMGDKARERLTIYDVRLGRLYATAPVDGAELLFDHKVVGKFPVDQPTYIPPGKHMLEVRKPGFQAYRVWIDFVAGHAHAEFFDLKPEEPAKVALKPGNVGGSLESPISHADCKAMYTGFDGSGGQAESARTVVFVSGIGLGLVGGAAGVGFLVTSIGQGSDAAELEASILLTRGSLYACGGATPDSQCATADAMRSAATGFGVASAVGFTMFAVGAAMTIYGAASSKPSESPNIVPVAGPRTAGAALVGRF